MLHVTIRRHPWNRQGIATVQCSAVQGMWWLCRHYSAAFATPPRPVSSYAAPCPCAGEWRDGECGLGPLQGRHHQAEAGQGPKGPPGAQGGASRQQNCYSAAHLLPSDHGPWSWTTRCAFMQNCVHKDPGRCPMHNSLTPPCLCCNRVVRTRARASSQRPRSRPCRTSTRLCRLHLLGSSSWAVGASVNHWQLRWCHCALSLQSSVLHHITASLHKRLCAEALWLHCNACVNVSA